VSETDEASNSLLLSVNPADGAQRTLELALHGMDCPGCANKVMVAARKLDGFRDIHADYIGCRAVLRIDTEIISAEAAVRFITRATGIQATILTDDDHPHGPRTTLPVRFSRPGPNLKLDLARFEQTSWLKVGNHYEVDFDPTCISGREILAHMCDHAPILVKRHEMISENSRARRELMYSALRAAFLISFTLPILVLAWGSFDLPFILRGGLQLGFSVPVMLGSSRIFINSARSVWYLRHADTQLLIAIGTSVAWLFSVSSYVVNLTGTSIENPFFETPTLLLAVVHLGYTIQALALRAGGSIVDALRGLQPDDALLLEGDTAIPIDHRLIHYGDVVRVNTNECVAADGIVISGAGCTDESLITGESKPIEKPIGSTVITGSRNTGSSMDVQVSRLWSESSVERVAGMVRQTQQSRLPVQDLADLIAGVLLPVSIACAALSFVIWTCVSKLIHGTSTSVAIVTGLTYAIAVVAVSCPCALVLTVSLSRLACPDKSRRRSS